MPSQRYVREFSVVMGLYFILLPISLYFLSGLEGLWKILLALLPAMPLLALIAVVLREIKCLDEFQQKLLTTSFAITLGITGFCTTILGFLENAGMPAISLIYVFPFMVSTWGICNIVLARRYR